MDREHIDQLRALYAQATQGPWQTFSDERGKSGTHQFVNGTDWYRLARVVVRMKGDDHDHPEGVANLELILAMHAALPQLLDLAEQQLRQQRRNVPQWED